MSFPGGDSGRGSESGWTMYIGSHISGTEDYKEQYCSYHNNDKIDIQHRGFDAESDDSMASDASSGPSHQELPCVSGEGRRRTDSNYKHTDDEFSSKSYSGKSKKHAKQRDERKVKVDKEKEKKKITNNLSLKVNSAASYVGSKVRKNK